MTKATPSNADLETIYTELEKLHAEQIGALPWFDNNKDRRILTAEAARTYIERAYKIVGDRALDPERPAIHGTMLCSNFFHWPSGDYPGIKLEDFIFLGDPQKTAEQVFKDIRVHGPLMIRGQCNHPSNFVFDNVEIDGDLTIAVANGVHDLVLDRVVCHGKTTIEVSGYVREISRSEFYGETTINSEFGSVLSSTKVTRITNDTYHGKATVTRNVHRDLDLRGTRFLEGVEFRSSTFLGTVDCRGVEFHSLASMRNCTFKGNADFSGSRFRGVADFTNATFNAETSFASCTFVRAPVFHDATLHAATQFRDATFSYVSHFYAPAWQAYRTLRERMGKAGANYEESEFFVHEQTALAILELKSAFALQWRNGPLYRLNKAVTALVSLAYGVLARYGASVTRPFVWLIATNWAAAKVYTHSGNIALSQGTDQSWARDVPCGVGLMLQNIVNPFGIFGKAVPYVPQSGLVAGLSIAQSLVSLALIALLILAVRRRFRKATE